MQIRFCINLATTIKVPSYTHLQGVLVLLAITGLLWWLDKILQEVGSFKCCCKFAMFSNARLMFTQLPHLLVLKFFRRLRALVFLLAIYKVCCPEINKSLSHMCRPRSPSLIIPALRTDYEYQSALVSLSIHGWFKTFQMGHIEPFPTHSSFVNPEICKV